MAPRKRLNATTDDKEHELLMQRLRFSNADAPSQADAEAPSQQPEPSTGSAVISNQQTLQARQ